MSHTHMYLPIPLCTCRVRAYDVCCGAGMGSSVKIGAILDTENISMAPAQGRRAQIDKC